MKKVSVLDLLYWVIIVAIIFSLARPGSKAGIAIVAVTDALAAVIGLSTGYVQRG